MEAYRPIGRGAGGVRQRCADREIHRDVRQKVGGDGQRKEKESAERHVADDESSGLHEQLVHGFATEVPGREYGLMLREDAPECLESPSHVFTVSSRPRWIGGRGRCRGKLLAAQRAFHASRAVDLSRDPGAPVGVPQPAGLRTRAGSLLFYEHAPKTPML